jgi:hypothetical protein
MAFVTANFHTNTMRGSQARGAAEAANAALVYGLSQALTAAGTATAATTTKAKIVNTTTYTVGGAFFSKGATDNFWTLGGTGSATVVAASAFQKYLLLIDTSGAASVLEGTQAATAAGVTWANISALSAYAPFLTAVGSTKCVVAVLTIATDSSHTFTPGTTALSAAGITATFADGIDQSILPLVGSENALVVGNGG